MGKKLLQEFEIKLNIKIYESYFTIDDFRFCINDLNEANKDIVEYDILDVEEIWKRCKKCGSKNIKQFADIIDDKTIEMEYECQDCGYSYKRLNKVID